MFGLSDVGDDSLAFLPLYLVHNGLCGDGLPFGNSAGHFLGLALRSLLHLQHVFGHFAPGIPHYLGNSVEDKDIR